jgi:predicted esterase
MTKEDRITDISDYVRYLDELRRSRLASDGPLPQVLLGFSQGVATAFRWLALGEGGPGSWQGIIAHSGIIPPDLPEQDDLLTQAPPLQLIAGTDDAFIDSLDAGFATSETEWSRLGGKPDISSRHTYPGGHDIDIASTLAALQRIG